MCDLGEEQMMATGSPQSAANRRQIGRIGTTARVVLGFVLLAFGMLGGKIILSNGRPHLEWDWAAIALGLVVFPALLLVLQWIRMSRDRARLEQTGPLPTTLNILVFALLVATASVPAISFIGFAAFVFYGASMLLAAARGYGGCEVLAMSNWLLRRDDQIGCLVLSPLDNLEKQRHEASGTHASGSAR
jgi:hypothetical protein